MSSTLVAQCFPCFYTDQEKAVISSPTSNDNNNNKKKPGLHYFVDFNQLQEDSNEQQQQQQQILKKTFVQSSLDQETQTWLHSKANPSSAKQVASDILYQFFGRTTANG